MKQAYHSNAVTNIHIRRQVQNSNQTAGSLAVRYNTSKATIDKWKKRDVLSDKSSRPHNIDYALSPLERALIVSIRQSTWLPLDEIWEMLLTTNPEISRSSVYRELCRSKINTVPQKEREKVKKFKEYKPGYLHLDVTYLPKIDGIKYYLFVAIDRATRIMFYKIYSAKTSENTEAFMKECLSFFPFKNITHVLTDNGLEFTNRLIKSKKGTMCQKPSKLDVICEENNIEHRLTAPFTPKTNGMVERVNGTIKKATILKEDYQDLDQMSIAFMAFLVQYNLFRRHGSIRRELNVKTPFNAIEKWFEIEPEIFKEKPYEFKNKLLKLSKVYEASIL